MLKSRRSLPAAFFAVLTLAAAGAPVRAQEGNLVGPPQLRDFQLPGERRTPARPQQVQPQPAQTPPAAQPAPSTAPQRQPERTQAQRPQPATPRADRTREAPVALPSQPEDILQLPQAPQATIPPAADPAAQPSAGAAPEPTGSGTPFWYYALGAGLLALAAALFLRRRRRPAEPAADPLAAAAAEPPAPRPAPVPRPWLELEVKAERAASTDSEAKVEFELILKNTGKSPARNIRVNARMFNAGREQDKEIGAFFRTKGEGRKTHTIGDLPAGQDGMIPGSVTMPREEVRALQVNNQLLFIPVLAVNVVYDWGSGRTGQTSKSYVIGRELGEENDKMGAFRLDLGPRIYRTVGQRQHSLAKRV
ncbi:MAG TPA: LPXTG cell wall anchor domain-containing protein [Allosphingosinicella sp.]|jgi:MYXO-CTERM domain-containing protein